MNLEKKIFQVLLVEDNLGDIRLTMEAFKEGIYEHQIHVAHDGVEALNYLRNETDNSQYQRPDIILLDLNLPKKDGREVLEDLKLDDDLKRIPVIVLTTSNAESDILQSYNLHANCYIKKPVDLDEFIRVVQSLEKFWFEHVVIPPK